MSVIHCPRCHEPVRIPVAFAETSAFPEGALGRCGWCDEAFPIAEALAGLPPLLQILSADGEILHSSNAQHDSSFDTVVNETHVNAAGEVNELGLEDDGEINFGPTSPVTPIQPEAIEVLSTDELTQAPPPQYRP